MSTQAMIQALYIYPIKSCQGISVETLELSQTGPLYDRNWMITDENGQFLTQRTHEHLAKIKTKLLRDSLQIEFDNQFFSVPLSSCPTETKNVQVWSSMVIAYLEEQKINAALSEFLKKKVILVRYGAQSKRTRKDFELRFSDASPVLVINQASLQYLCSKAGVDIPANRFRANIIINSGSAFEEDHWQELISESGMVLRNAGPCARCGITTKDQTSGISHGPEPLKTLAQFRRNSEGVVFGANMVPSTNGVLKIGERLLAS